MPCCSDHMNPSGEELESKRVCGLLLYLYQRLRKDTPPWVMRGAVDYYGNTRRLDEATKVLCATCRGLSPGQVEEFIYDAHNREARRLASWWERHQEWDERRVSEEEASRLDSKLRLQALNKLTNEEIRALRLKDK